MLGARLLIVYYVNSNILIKSESTSCVTGGGSSAVSGKATFQAMVAWKQYIVFAIKLVMVTLSCIGFLFHVKVQFSKFVSGDTTLTSRDIKVDSLHYPAITVCSDRGFKEEALQQLGLSDSFWVLERPDTGSEWVFNKSSSEWEDLADATSFQLHDIFESIKLHRPNLNVEIKLQDNEALTLKKIPTSTNRGHCYFLKINVPTVNKTDYVELHLRNGPGLETLNIYLHSDLGESYLNAYDYWITQPVMLYMDRGYKYNGELTVERSIQDPGKRSCDVGGTIKRTHQCILESMATSCQPCSFPYFTILLGGNNTRVCSSREEVLSTYSCIYSGIFSARSVCQAPCVVESYKLSSRRKLKLGTQGNSSSFIFYFKHLEIQEQEEYVLFDFSAILAAVGGSMGMFLGFSFLDFGLGMVGRLDKMIANGRMWDKKKKKKHLEFSDEEGVRRENTSSSFRVKKFLAESDDRAISKSEVLPV